MLAESQTDRSKVMLSARRAADRRTLSSLRNSDRRDEYRRYIKLASNCQGGSSSCDDTPCAMRAVEQPYRRTEIGYNR